jgi:hypothetical protein
VSDASPFVILPPQGEDAALDLAVSIESGGEEDESIIRLDGDEVAWTLRVTNTGEEFLWGIYAHMEGYGRMTCDRRRLDSGETALCTATEAMINPDHEGWLWLWATGWTSTSVIGTDVVYPLVPVG